MGKNTGFMEYDRKSYHYRDIIDRVNDYKELIVPLSKNELEIQGSRCMDCGIPYCHSLGCPINNLIPEWNDLVYSKDWYTAYKRLELTNALPEITGRLCPAPCEAACTLSINSSPVTIKQLELAIIENAFEKGWVIPRPPKHKTGKRVAIIGSGPAGLAAAQKLRRAGHRVTVFEKSNKIGGILRYGIPDFKLEKSIIDRRLEQFKLEGIEFETNVVIGEDLSVKYLKRMFDAILLTIGAGEPRNLLVPGRDFEGVYYAMDYLTRVNKFNAGEIDSHSVISARNKTVLVVGGGDTGSDCVGTAIRQQAKKVYQYEILPKPKVWNDSWNPNWPDWPNILRTSSSHEEGGERDWGISIKSLSGQDIFANKAHCVRVDWKLDDSTKQYKMEEIPDTGFTIDVDIVLLAMGFVHVEYGRLLEDFGVTFDKKGNILTGADYSTAAEGVFSAGDAVSGPSLVVRAINHGNRAALSIDKYLS